MYFKNLPNFTFLQIGFFSLIVLLAASCKEEGDPNAQMNAAVAAIDEHLEDSVEPVLYDQTGIRMVIHQLGDNAPPHTGQTVSFDYEARLFPDETVIETGTMNDKLENMPTDGLAYALSSMMGRSISTFYVPYINAYGETGKTGVPPYSTVVYEILTPIEVTRTSAEQTQFTKDTTDIQQYLNTNGIKNAVKLLSGVWYTIDAAGTGRYPTPYDNITFQYKLTIMSNGSVSEGSLPEQGDTISPFGLIDGLKVGLPRMQEGGIATFYVPSGLAYGPAGRDGVPVNANLIFRIQLNSVQPYFK